jgi:hypothetical protein
MSLLKYGAVQVSGTQSDLPPSVSIWAGTGEPDIITEGRRARVVLQSTFATGRPRRSLRDRV